MDQMKRTGQGRTAVISVTYTILIILSIVCLLRNGLTDLEDVYIINMSVDIFGMIIGYVLFICCRFAVFSTVIFPILTSLK